MPLQYETIDTLTHHEQCSDEDDLTSESSGYGSLVSTKSDIEMGL